MACLTNGMLVSYARQPATLATVIGAANFHDRGEDQDGRPCTAPDRSERWHSSLLSCHALGLVLRRISICTELSTEARDAVERYPTERSAHALYTAWLTRVDT